MPCLWKFGTRLWIVASGVTKDADGSITSTLSQVPEYNEAEIVLRSEKLEDVFSYESSLLPYDHGCFTQHQY